MIIGWTGQRPELFADPFAAQGAVKAIAAQAALLWPLAEFVCGGQRGVDTWAASEAYYLGVPLQVHLILPLPIDRFSADWPDDDRARLEALASLATSVAVINESGERGALAYDLRNEAVARKSDLLVAVWTGLRQGGTFFTLSAAKHWGRPVVERVLPSSGQVQALGRGL